jgi:hypothetical protein
MSARAFQFVPSSAGRSLRTQDLPLWLGEQLWEVEPVRRHISAWSAATAAEFATACAERARDAARSDTPFGELYAADAEAYAAGISEQAPGRAARNAATVALIAREAAEHAAGPEARQSELEWQARWLARRMRLDG